jgi:hypothetical protein
MRRLHDAGIGVAALALAAGCTASPTVRGYAGLVPAAADAGPGCAPIVHGAAGHSGLDSGAPGPECLISPTPPNRGRSAGCGKTRTEPSGRYVEFSLTVTCEGANARDRLYYVRLPPNYDANTAYRTVYLGPGCGPPQDSLPECNPKAYSMETVSDPDAILIAMEQGFYNKAEYNSAGCSDDPTAGVNNLCHYCFDDGAATNSPDSVEYGYFDRLHKQVEADFCVDTDRQFFGGYSSGGWMAHQLGCQFPDVLRAQGSVTGGLPSAIRDGTKACVDHPIAAFLIHDSMDTSNVYAGSVAALERLLALNKCQGGTTMREAPTAPYEIAAYPNNADFNCLRYSGCPAEYPIVFCTSRGQAHGAQTSAAVPGFWEFFKSL